MSEQAPQHLEILTAAYDIQAVAKPMLASHLVDVLNEALAKRD
jgi:hypothetical protein